MDPLTAVGLASNIISFIDFAAKLVDTTFEIHQSVSGATSKDQTLDKATRHLKAHAKKLEADAANALDPSLDDISDLASDCEEVAQQLLGHLADVQAKDPTSKRQSAKAAIKRYWKAAMIRELKGRLDIISDVLQRQVQMMNHTEVTENLRSLVDQTSKTDSDRASLQNKLDSISSTLGAIALNNESVKTLQSMLRITELSILEARQEKVLSMLYFSSMNTRYSGVEPAHRKTFEWILVDAKDNRSTTELSKSDTDTRVSPSLQPLNLDSVAISTTDAAEVASYVPDESSESGANPSYLNEAMLLARQTLNDWLARDSAVLHLLGKPGCGKSTLMKFLVDHETTRQRLQTWAGDRKLILSHFFFWKPGDQMQKSREGLMRSLLYSILDQQRELISEVLTEQWTVTSSPILHTARGMSPIDIELAFRTLLSLDHIGANHCFAFFLDGLDEFEATGARQTYSSLARELSTWSTANTGSVKICVSSREYPEIEEALKDHPRIRLQDLTSQDIAVYVDDFFDQSVGLNCLTLDKAELHDLKKDLNIHSQGVFLWVALVLRNTERGLINGDGIRDLKVRLLAIPTELEDMLIGILCMIDPLDRQYCLTMIRIVSWLEQSSGLSERALNLYYMWFVEAAIIKRFSNDQHYAQYRNNKPQKQLEHVAKDLQQLSKRIKWRCCGLLTVSNPIPRQLNTFSQRQYWAQDNEAEQTSSRLSWTQPRDDTLLDVFCQDLRLLHRSVGELVGSDKLQELWTRHSCEWPSAEYVWESLFIYMSWTMKGELPFFQTRTELDWYICRGCRPRPFLESRAGYALSETMRHLIARSLRPQSVAMSAANLHARVEQADETAALNPKWSGWVCRGTGGSTREALDIYRCVVSAQAPELLSLMCSRQKEPLQDKSLWLLEDACWGHYAPMLSS